MTGYAYTAAVAVLLAVLVSVSGQSTNFVDQDSKVSQFAEPGWFKENIPFLEVPDKEIENVYYYRWSSLKRHLRYTVLGAGYIVTEFVHNTGYSQKFGTINAAAGHHIYEARWLKNKRYVQDYINFWAKEGGGNQQYSEWVADATYSTYLLDGDVEFIKSQQEGLVHNFRGWEERFEPLLNLYFITPHDDAQEQSASSIQTDDPYRGGLGYRPSFNSEMYGNIRALAKIARMNGDSELAAELDTRADNVRQAVMDVLWDNERQFFYHMQRENNTNNELLDTREEVGFYPWHWGVPTNDSKYAAAWESLYDPEGFDTTYGPTTCEQRSKWYDGDQIATCCWWNGNSWPYSTSLTLNSLAAQVRDYFTTDFVNAESYVASLHKYAVTQHKNGVPYVAECHSPEGDFWVCDSHNWSEHYAHSTYNDNVLAELIGIIPREDDVFEVNPIVSESWAYFIAENVQYHGHNVTVLYDRDGTKYQTGRTGLQIFVNGEFVAAQATVGPMRVAVPPPVIEDHSGKAVKMENYASNVNAQGYPAVEASFSDGDGNKWNAVDGKIIYDYIPLNRWSNFASRNDVDWYSVNFGPGRAKTINEVKIYVYSDVVTGEGGVDCPTAITLEVHDGNDWIQAPNQVRNPLTCSPNDLNTITFDAYTTEQIRLHFTRDVANNYFVGITEIEIWAPFPQTQNASEYEAEDGYIVGAEILRSTQASSGSYVGQLLEEGSLLEFTGLWANQNGEYKIEVFYANGHPSAAMLNVISNNIFTDSLQFEPTANGWGSFDEATFLEFRVPFVRGNNNIIFRNAVNSIEVDKIRVTLV